MKAYQRIEQKITKYQRPISSHNSNNNKENISQMNYRQNKENKKLIKSSISSINCRLPKKEIQITPIKRNNSNSKITSNHQTVKSDLDDKKINKRNYIVTIVDRRKQYLENKNNFVQRHQSFSRNQQIGQKIENKVRDKSFDLKQSYSQTKIDNKYLQKTTSNTKINTITVKNNNKENKQNPEKRNIFNLNKIEKNDQERLSTEPVKNYSIYISGSSNKYSDTKNKKNDTSNNQMLKPIKTIYSIKTDKKEQRNINENNNKKKIKKQKLNYLKENFPIQKNLNKNKNKILNNLFFENKRRNETEENDTKPKYRFINIKKELLEETTKINKMFISFGKQIKQIEKEIKFRKKDELMH